MSVGKTIDGCTFEPGQGMAAECDDPKPAARLIGLCGYAGSGKDAAAACLTSLPDGHPDGPWKRLAFADAARAGLLALGPAVAYRMVPDEREDESELSVSIIPVPLSEYIEICGGWDEAKKSPEVRRLLQRYGTEAGREIHGGDCWVEIVERAISQNRADVGPGGQLKFVITDVRFQNELDMIRRYGGTIVRISRPGVGPKNDHVSERLVGEITPDAEIVNDGSLDDLRAKLWTVAGVREWEPPAAAGAGSEDYKPIIKRSGPYESALRRLQVAVQRIIGPLGW